MIQLVLLSLLAFASSIDAQSNPLPGWEFMFAGYDIRNASSTSFVDGIKYQIFVPTYTMHQTFQRPDSPIIYDVPDQMFAYPLSETTVLTSTDIYVSVDEMLTEETTSFSFGIGFNIGKFGINASFNRTSGYIHYIFDETDQFAAKGHLTSNTAKLVIGPYPLFTLNPYFDILLNQRIPQCPKTAADIQNVALLIEIFGQVFPTDIFMGGRFDCVTSLDQNLVKKYDKSWIYTQLSLKFTYDGFDLYAGGFQNRTDIHIDTVFSQMTKTSMFFEGGSRALQSNDTEKPWFASIDDNPSLISASLQPLSVLATDPVKQRNLEYMLTNHINTGQVTAPPCAYEHPAVTGMYYSEIPGTPFVGAGYDSLTMTPKGFIIDHTFTTGQTWTNPFYPSYTYSVPDTLYVWDNTDSIEENYTSVSMSSSQFQQTLRSHVKGSDFLGFGSHSSSMYVFQSYVEFHDDVETMNLRSINWYDLELTPIVQVEYLNFLTPWAKEIFTTLGTDLNDPKVKAQYWLALQVYGDSIITRVGMGGRLNYQGFLNNDTVQSITVESFQESSSWSFFGIFGSKSSYNYYQKNVDETVKASMIALIQAEGGLWDPGSNKAFTKTASGAYSFALKDINENVLDFQDFVDSIKDNMVPVRYEIMPIANIFADPVIRNNFMTVTQEYLASQMKGRQRF